MDPLNEATYFPLLSPLLLWIKNIEVCSGILLILALLTLLMTWVRHVPWRLRLSALVPLAAGIAAGVVAHALHTTYAYWDTLSPRPLPENAPLVLSSTRVSFQHIQNGIASATQAATVLGWSSIVATGILLVLGLVSAWRLVATGRSRRLPPSVTSEF